jgi:integrative and conjugative element protein (TIGR02256 family)
MLIAPIVPVRNIWLDRKQLKKIVNEVLEYFPYETGGTLAGYIGDNGEKVITQITASGPKAQHHLHSYVPDYKFDEEQIAKIYRKSKRIEIYLGDWHSHPGSTSYMSIRDKDTLERIAKFDKARIDTPVMLILGTTSLEIKGWEFRKTFLELSVVLF